MRLTSRRVAKLLRTELIPRPLKWVPQVVGALLTGALAYVCLFRAFAEWWFCGFLLAFFAMSFALTAADLLADQVNRRRRRHTLARVCEGACVRCGYDLRHLRSRQCPECGAPFIARRGMLRQS